MMAQPSGIQAFTRNRRVTRYAVIAIVAAIPLIAIGVILERFGAQQEAEHARLVAPAAPVAARPAPARAPLFETARQREEREAKQQLHKPDALGDPRKW